MKFEVIDRDGRTMMSTELVNHIPPDRHLDSMSQAGYTFRIDGKKVSKTKVKEFVRNEIGE